jgi:hypothetical protein
MSPTFCRVKNSHQDFPSSHSALRLTSETNFAQYYYRSKIAFIVVIFTGGYLDLREKVQYTISVSGIAELSAATILAEYGPLDGIAVVSLMLIAA